MRTCVYLCVSVYLCSQAPSIADLHLPRDSQGNTDFGSLVRQLKECPTLQDQADILYILCVMKGTGLDQGWANCKRLLSFLHTLYLVVGVQCGLEFLIFFYTK